ESRKANKRNASLAKSPTKVVRSQKNHIFASIVAYCKLEFLKTKTSLSHFGMKYMLLMKANRAAFLELGRWRFNHGKF
ncbi:MAG: transposase, partial [Chlamydiia bacterium]|nr:transposase [Chlamydiia bacterium]